MLKVLNAIRQNHISQLIKQWLLDLKNIFYCVLLNTAVRTCVRRVRGCVYPSSEATSAFSTALEVGTTIPKRHCATKN